MPRKARIDAVGALHHIIVRGIERRAIVRDDVDREHFLGRLGNLLLDSKTSCYAWAVLRNHVHLLLRTGTVPVATLMARLLTGYAASFNRRHRRHGVGGAQFTLISDDPHTRKTDGKTDLTLSRFSLGSREIPLLAMNVG
jgi:REP element-mobilizing transposase RayT